MLTSTWDQEKFDKEFILSSEIYKRLEIDRSTLLQAVNTGKMPKPISLPQSNIWVRSEVEQIIQDWQQSLNKRRRVH